MSNNKFDNVLNECLDRMLQGESIEQCLGRYPEQARELEPLLRTAQTARMASAIQPRTEFKAKARFEFQSALRDMSAKKSQRTSIFPWRWQWQTGWAIALVAIMIVVISGGGTVMAAGGSMPDNTLYSVKLATEKVHLAFTFSDIQKAELNAEFADRRVEEIIYLAVRGTPEDVQVVAQRLNSNLTNMNSLVGDIPGQEAGLLGEIRDPQNNLASQSGPDAQKGDSARSNDQQPMIAAAPPPATFPAVIASSPATVSPDPEILPMAQNGYDTNDGSLVHPGTGATDVSPRPVFQWSPVDGAASYDIQISESPDFTSLLEEQTGLQGTFWSYTGNLSYGRTYYWRFRSIEADGRAGGWIASAFTVITEPSLSTPLSTPAPAGISAPTETVRKSYGLSAPGDFSPAPDAATGEVISPKQADSRAIELDKLKRSIIHKAMINKARLEEALAKASPEVRPALLQALSQAMAEYDKAIWLIERNVRIE